MDKNFFSRDPRVVAQELLGKLLVRHKENGFYIGKIVETEAYLAENDTACHASKGKTKRNEVMFGEPGRAYVYMIYGMYYCLNVVTEAKNKPSAVLVRALEPLEPSYDNLTLNEKRKKVSGPGRLTRWLEIDKSFNGKDLSKRGQLFITHYFKSGSLFFESQQIPKNKIVATKRIGVDYSEHAHLPLRFYIKGNSYISKP